MHMDSGIWNGNLLNTKIDVFIDSALLFFIVCAYVPQISRLRNASSPRGMSAYHVLFTVFFSNAQLSMILLCAAYAWPTNLRSVIGMINDGSLEGVKAFGGILGLLQSLIQWLCSVILLVLFAAYSSPADRVRGRVVVIAASLHAAAVLVIVVGITLPVPTTNDMAIGTVVGLIGMSNEIVGPVFVILQCYAQYREMKSQNRNPGALSLLSVGLQIVTIGLMGFRWFLRIGHPKMGLSYYAYYAWALPAMDYILHAAGSCFILACYAFGGRRTSNQDGIPEERRPLLS